MPHVWHLYARFVPEARRALARIGDFLQARM
jgi:acetyl esterase/lipase